MKISAKKKKIFALQRFQSVMVRLTLTFFLLITPIFILGLSIYQSGVSQLERQINHMMQNQVSVRVADVEKQMRLAQTQMHQLCNENSLQRLAGMPDTMSRYERFVELNTLQERLLTIRDANPLLRQVTVYLPTIDYMVRADGYGKWMTAALDQNVFEQAWEISAYYSGKLVYTNDRMLYTSQLPLPTSIGTEREPRILFELEYDMTALFGSFSDLLDAVDTSFMFVYADGSVLGGAPVGDSWENALTVLCDEETPRKGTLNLRDKEAYICGVWSEQMNVWCMAYAPRAQAFAELNRFRTFLIALTILFVLVLLIYCVSTYLNVYKPLRLLTGAFERLAQGDMDFQIQYKHLNEFSYLTDQFNQMVHELKMTMRKLYEQHILMQQAQIKQLQAQINPHFLYNSLFILNNMIAVEDCEAASLMSRSLGEYFRYIARNGRDMVSLSEELDHARSYVEVQRIRFGKRLRMEFPESTPESKRVMVPRLSVQPILENAFVHALERNDSGELIVRLISGDEALRLEVENTGFLEDDAWLNTFISNLDDDRPDREITALVNIHKRLKLTFGEGLSFERIEPDRLKIVLTIPIETQKWTSEEWEETR